MGSVTRTIAGVEARALVGGGKWWALPDGAEVERNEGGPGWWLVPVVGSERLCRSLEAAVEVWKSEGLV